MIRANIYSVDPLSSDFEQSVFDGLQTVGQYVGGIAVNRVMRIKLPQKNGLVNHKNVGYRNIDKMVELHLFAVPLFKHNGDEAGYGLYGRGIARVNIDAPKPDKTSAHETAHSLGFTLSQSEPAGHCDDMDCIMYPYGFNDQKTLVNRKPVGFREKFSGLLNGTKFVEEKIVSTQTDFCNSCTDEMNVNAESHIARLRHERIRSGMPSKALIRILR